MFVIRDYQSGGSFGEDPELFREIVSVPQFIRMQYKFEHVLISSKSCYNFVAGTSALYTARVMF